MAEETASTLSALPAASALTRLLFLVTALFSIAGMSGEGVADVEPREQLLLLLLIPPPPLADSASFSRSFLLLHGTDNTPLGILSLLETAAVLASDLVLGRDLNPPSSSSFSAVNTSPFLQREENSLKPVYAQDQIRNVE